MARSSERMKEFLKMTWSYFGGRTCLWKLSGCWDGVILRDDFTQTNVAYGIILTGFYCQSELGNTTESNCTIVGLKLYRRDFMQ